RLRGEHLAQDRKDLVGSLLIDCAQPPHEPDLVHCSDLVQDDLRSLSLEPDRNPRRIGTPMCSHRSDNDGVDVAVHLVRRDDETGASLAYLAPYGRVQAHKMDLKP